MILFRAPEFGTIAEGLLARVPGLREGNFQTRRFHNRELLVEVETDVQGETCVVLGSIAPPDAQLLSALLLAHTLRREGAKRIIGVFPYLAYSRQDKEKPRESLAVQWIGAMAQSCGLDRVVTVDVHSPDDQRLFPVPLISLSPARLLVCAMKANQLLNATLVAPDQGAISRCEAVRNAADLPEVAISYFEKRRLETGIQHLGFVGEVGTHVVLIDDILDTGATLVSACQRLLCAGVEDIEIMVTHGLFTGTKWQELWASGVSRIFCTDSVPLPPDIDKGRIVSLSIIPVLAESLSGSACHD